MNAVDPADLGPLIPSLWREDFLNDLGAGRPNQAAREELAQLASPTALGAKVVDRAAARACHAGLLLLHDFLDDSHSISQELDTREGSYWHAIMHRREGDFWNSKYWLRRVGAHPIDRVVAADVAQLFENLPADERPAEAAELAKKWDKGAFVDLCETATRRAELRPFCQRVQRLEWERLLEHCYLKAIGR